MLRALDGRAPAATASHQRNPLLVALPAAALALAGWAVLAGGGSAAGPVAWIGAAAVLAAAGGAAAGFLRTLPLPAPGPSGIALAGLLAAFAAWSGVTVLWSVEPDRTWDSMNRVLAYLALLALGMVAGAVLRSPPRAAAAGLAGVLGAGLVWSLAGKVLPALGPEVDRSARLVGPLGYWNALALAAGVSLPLWLWLSSRTEHRSAVRAAAVLALSWAIVALLLTGSRGGVLVAGIAVAVWLVLAPPRLESGLALALAVPVGVGLGALALSRPGIADPAAGTAARDQDGALLGLLLLVGGGAVFAAALAALRRLESAPLAPARRRGLARALALAAALAVALALGAGLVRAGGPGAALDAFRNPPEEQLTDDPAARIFEPSSNHRWTWWTQAWAMFESNRLGGVGAGAYELARRPARQDTRAPLDPHNLGLKALSETGLLGLLLLLAAVAAGAWTVVSALRRLGGAERAAAAALAAGAAAWLAHALVDMTWEFVAVTGPLFLVLGVLAVPGRPAAAGGARRPVAAVGAVALAAAALTSLVSPWLAERREDAALDALAGGRIAEAVGSARDAQALNPLAVRPLHLEAAALEAVGRLDDAERLYRRAIEVQPQNPVPWYELGRFEYEARENLQEALYYLDRAWGLDRWNADTGRLLDAVRADLAAG
jgi:O-antigen ligase